MQSSAIEFLLPVQSQKIVSVQKLHLARDCLLRLYLFSSVILSYHLLCLSANLLTEASPDLVFMAGGLPNAQLFPFQAASITLKDGHALTIHPKLMTDCLQYGPTPG